MTHKEQIFRDIQSWLFENHFLFVNQHNDPREDDLIIFSMDFEEWLREYLEVSTEVN